MSTGVLQISSTELPAAPSWLERLRACVRQEPLVQSGASLRALARSPGLERPGAVLVGVGLCTRDRLSRSLPVDILAMLLPAEAVRRAVGARRLVVLVADQHALTNDLDPEQVDRRARETAALLAGARQVLGLDAMDIVRASSVHCTPAYQRALARVRRVAPADQHDYILRQVADYAYFEREAGGLLKVGWALGRRVATELSSYRDETAFDERARLWLGDRIGFVYCRPGRVLDDERTRSVPYVAVEPERRVCLSADEDVRGKLARAERRVSPCTVNAYRNLLRAINYSAARMTRLPRGTIVERTQALINAITAAARVRAPARRA